MCENPFRFLCNGHIAATAGFAIKKGDDTIILESPHCKNGNKMQIFVKEGDSCKTIDAGSSYTTKNAKIQYSGKSIRVDGFNARVGGVWNSGYSNKYNESTNDDNQSLYI